MTAVGIDVYKRQVLDRHGIAAAVSKMAFGNGMGVKIESNVDKRDPVSYTHLDVYKRQDM